MPTRRAAARPLLGPMSPSTRDLRTDLDRLPAEARRLVRTAGTALATASLVVAFAAAAQTAAYGPRTETGGALAWLFAVFVGAAVLAIFFLVLSLVRNPRRPDGHLPGTARDR